MLNFFGSWLGYEITPFAERYRLIKQAGFDGTLVWWDEEAPKQGNYRKQPEELRRAGLYLENMHSDFGHAGPLWKDSIAGQTTFEYYMMCLTDCGIFEIPTMVMHVGCGMDPLPPLDKIGLYRFARMIDKAERLSINIAIENQGCPEKTLRAMELLERFDSLRLGMCYDSGHASQHKNLGRGAEMLERFGHRLRALHLHDNDGSGDQHLPPLTETGIIDWPVLMKKIANTGYTGPTTLELGGGTQGLKPEEYLALAYERAKKVEVLRYA